MRIAAVVAAVRRGRLARRRGEVRPAAAGGLRAPGRRRAAAAGSTTCPTSSTRRCSGSRPDDVRRDVPRRRAQDAVQRVRAAAGTTRRWPTPSCDLGGHDLAEPARGLPRVRRRDATGRASSSPTRSRAGGCRSPATRATTRRCCRRRPDRRAARRSSGSTRATEWDRIDPLDPGRRVGGHAARAPRASPPPPGPLGVAGARSDDRRSYRQADLDPGGRSAACWSTCPATTRSRRTS